MGAQELYCKLNPGGPRENASLGLLLKIAVDQCDDAPLPICFWTLDEMRQIPPIEMEELA